MYKWKAPTVLRHTFDAFFQLNLSCLLHRIRFLYMYTTIGIFMTSNSFSFAACEQFPAGDRNSQEQIVVRPQDDRQITEVDQWGMYLCQESCWSLFPGLSFLQSIWFPPCFINFLSNTNPLSLVTLLTSGQPLCGHWVSSHPRGPFTFCCWHCNNRLPLPPVKSPMRPSLNTQWCKLQLCFSLKLVMESLLYRIGSPFWLQHELS